LYKECLIWVKIMRIEIGRNESRRLDVTGVPCGMIAVAGDTWHFEVLAGRVFLVENMVESLVWDMIEIFG